MQETIVIPVLDPIKHTDAQQFCSDWECPCHSDVEAVNAITDQVVAGLLTWAEANLILRGENI